jgi:hypothetical protein
MHAEVRSVEDKKSAKPSQFSSPKMPAVAPAKHADMNLTEFSEEFAMTLGR